MRILIRGALVLRSVCSNLSAINPRVGLANKNASAKFSTSGAKFNPTIEEYLRRWCKIFKAHNVSEPLESIAIILASNLNVTKIPEVYKMKKLKLSNVQVEKITEMCNKRLKSMPVQYIIGEWDFHEITLKMRPPVFIPRAETEILVELVLEEIKKQNIQNVLELCCGSGAITLALLHKIPELQAISVDKSEDACTLTKENAQMLKLDNRLKILQTEIAKINLGHQKFDLIISNPPYILNEQMSTLQPETLLYEDLDALNGGEDGLNVVKDIFHISSRYLNPGGKLFLEVDPSHPQLIKSSLAINADLGLYFLHPHRDLSNITRFVEIIKT